MATVASYSTSSVVNPATPNSVVPITAPTGIALGNLLIFSINQLGGNITNQSTPSGWTALFSNNSFAVVPRQMDSYWKIADAGDVATSTYNFTITGVAGPSDVLLSMARITGTSGASPIAAANGGTTVTPTQNQLLIILGLASTSGSSTVVYAIANSNPTWSAGYLVQNGAGENFNLGYASRTSITATGSASTTYTPGENAQLKQFIVIDAPVFANLTETVTTTETNVGISIIITLREVITLVESLTKTVQTVWTNTVKHVSSWINGTKH